MATVELTTENFDDVVGGSGIVMVAMYVLALAARATVNRGRWT